MLGAALAYPRRNEHWLTTILIGGILSLLGVLILPAIVVQGYLVRVLRSAAMDEETAPVFDVWGDLLVDGLKVFLIALTYLGVPYGVLVGVIGFTSGSATDEPSPVSLIIGLVAVALLLVAAFLTPVALTNFALTDRLGGAFEFTAIFGAAFTSQYVVAVILAVVIGGILQFIAGVLTLLIVGIFLAFYVQVMVFYLFGQGCGPTLVEHRSAGVRADCCDASRRVPRKRV